MPNCPYPQHHHSRGSGSYAAAIVVLLFVVAIVSAIVREPQAAIAAVASTVVIIIVLAVTGRRRRRGRQTRIRIAVDRSPAVPLMTAHQAARARQSAVRLQARVRHLEEVVTRQQQAVEAPREIHHHQHLHLGDSQARQILTGGWQLPDVSGRLPAARSGEDEPW